MWEAESAANDIPAHQRWREHLPDLANAAKIINDFPLVSAVTTETHHSAITIIHQVESVLVNSGEAIAYRAG